MAYRVEGRMLEVCNCNALCPCWIGDDPDYGACQATVMYHIDRGAIDGVDVSGLSLGLVTNIPGNVLAGHNWRVIFYVDDRATPQQGKALADVFSGKLGGPLEQFAQLYGEVVAVERAPIAFEVEKGKGHMRIGTIAEAELEPLVGATGQPTTLQDTVFSTIPGSPAYVGKATMYRAKSPALGIDLDLQGHNATQGSFRFES